MEGRQAIGIGLVLFGLWLVTAAALGRTGVSLAALLYGETVLREGT